MVPQALVFLKDAWKYIIIIALGITHGYLSVTLDSRVELLMWHVNSWDITEPLHMAVLDHWGKLRVI